jgi:hypothetical protein
MNYINNVFTWTALMSAFYLCASNFLLSTIPFTGTACLLIYLFCVHSLWRQLVHKSTPGAQSWLMCAQQHLHIIAVFYSTCCLFKNVFIRIMLHGFNTRFHMAALPGRQPLLWSMHWRHLIIFNHIAIVRPFPSLTSYKNITHFRKTKLMRKIHQHWICRFGR